MQIIASHINTDFDALASMLAAKKLYPNARIVISSRQHTNVKHFLNIYRDTFDYVYAHDIDWSKVKELILVDTSSLSRVSPRTRDLPDDVAITIYDHHDPENRHHFENGSQIEKVGATVTLLIEQIIKLEIPITSFEATLFGLGIYTDTGFFTYNHTTARDLKAASYLMEQGMNVEIVEKFSEQRLEVEQQKILDILANDAMTYEQDGVQITLATASFAEVHSGLALVTEKLLDMKGTDAAVVVVGMKNHVLIVGRASSERITLLPLLKKFGGGGHKHAASATIKDITQEKVWDQVKKQIFVMIKPATTAKEIMKSPVKTITPETSIEKAAESMYRYEHSGYPVVENETIVGVITRRDLDKAIHHGLGHAPVKAYMSTDVITSTPSTPLEKIQNLIIEHNIGRLPIVEKGEIVGIITRTDMIQAMHEEEILDDLGELPNNNYRNNIRVEMKQQLHEDIFPILEDIGRLADQMNMNIYLIGGIVRDILLQVANDDIDIVVEGDGISFAKKLQKTFGGELVIHENFGTATWTHPSEFEIDLASSRLEFYDRPASLPNVEFSTLREDLYRRDFTINAMAVCLNERDFGSLVDPFAGRLDIFNRRVRVLHNLSFVEDPTRIFRAIRFELRYDFKMNEHTEQLVKHSIDQVVDLSIDRIIAEMKRLFKEHYPTQVIRRLFELSFWQQYGIQIDIIQQSNNHAKRLDNLYKKGTEFGLSGGKPNWFMNFMIPFYYEEDEEGIHQFAVTRRDKRFAKEVFQLREKIDVTEKDIGKLHELLSAFSQEAILFVIAEQDNNHKEIQEYVKRRKNLSPLIKGSDLQALGLKPGPRFSEIMFQLEIAILKEEVSSKKEAIAWIKEHYLK